MVDNQQNGQNPPAQAPVKKMVKLPPMVKRVKVPVAGQAVPHPAAPHPAPKIIQPQGTDSEPPLPPEEEDVPQQPVFLAESAAPQPVPAAQPAQPVAAPPPPAAEPQTAEKQPAPSDSASASSSPAADKGGTPVEAAQVSSRKRRRENNVSGKAAENAAKKKAQQAIEEAKKRAASFWKRKIVRLGVFVVVLAGVLAGVYSYLPVLAEKKLPEIFAANGLKLRSFKVKELTIGTMELTGLTDKGGTLSISSLKAEYSLKELLMDNKLKSITIKGLTVTGVRRDDGISLGAFGNLLSSSLQAKKGLELDLPKLSINNSSFVMKREREKELLDENGDPIDETAVVNFSATGKLQKSVLEMTFLTDYESPNMRLKTKTDLKKSANEAEIKTEITEGEVLKQSAAKSDDFDVNPPNPPNRKSSVPSKERWNFRSKTAR